MIFARILISVPGELVDDMLRTVTCSVVRGEPAALAAAASSTTTTSGMSRQTRTGATITLRPHPGRTLPWREITSELEEKPLGGLFAGRGHSRRDPSSGQIDKVIDGWICGSGAGGFSCGRLGPHGTVRPYKPGQPTIDAEAVSPPAAVAKHPPCTKKAIAAGLRRGANKIPGAPIEGFRCAGRWAFAVVLDGVDDVPALFRAQGTRWVTVDREKPCNDHVVPKKIYVAACLSS